MRRSTRTGRHAAFTLLELLLVIALLSLLAGLLYPTLAVAREQARGAVCFAHVRQLALAQRLYCDDWDERLPHWWQWTAEGVHAPFTYWTELFQPYLRGRGTLRCPSAAGESTEEGAGERLADYTLFTWGPSGTGSAADPYWRWAGPPMTLAQIARPAATFNLSDGMTATQWTRGFLTRHRGGMNAGFLDGHVRWLRAGALFAVEREPSGFYRYRFIAADRE